MPKPLQKNRVVFRAEVDPKTAKRFAAMCEDTGITQITVTSRLVHWFAQQDEHTQMCVLGVLGEDAKAAAARAYLERIARDGFSAV